MPMDGATAVSLDFTPAQRRRSLAAVIASAGVVGVTVGYTVPLLALIMEKQGYSSWEIGLNGAAPALATITLGPLVPRLISRFGMLDTVMWSIVIGMVLMLALPLLPGMWTWFALRYLIGFCGTIQWIGSETWIVALASPEKRGRAVAYYMILLCAGFAIGPLLVNLVGADDWPSVVNDAAVTGVALAQSRIEVLDAVGWTPFLAGAGLVLVALPILWQARGIEPTLPKAPPFAFAMAFRMAPLVMAAAFLAGFTDTAALTHFAIYAERGGHTQSMALLLLSIMLTANVLLQLPIGWTAERVNKRRMLILFGGIFFAAPLLFNVGLLDPWILWPTLVAWGAASLGIYTIALMILGDRFPPSMLSSANAAIVGLYQLGAITGQPAGGAGMDLWDWPGLMWVLSAAAALFLVFAAYRSWIARPREARRALAEGRPAAGGD